MNIHVVRRGDTIASIARQYGVSQRWITLNNQASPGSLVVGQTLVILAPRVVHVVQPGETLLAVARGYGVSVNQLWRNNIWLGGRGDIRPGDELVVEYTDPTGPAFAVVGYAYPFVSWALMRQTLPYVGMLMPFTYGLDDQGELVPLNDLPLIGLAREYGVQPYLHLSNLGEDGRFFSARAAMVLEDMALQQTLIDNVLQAVASRGYSGVDVDFEYIEGKYAQSYVDFLGRLADRLHPLGKKLVAAVAPKESAGQQGLLYEGHDYAGIGRVCDMVLLMTYEWGYAYSSPRAVAPEWWVRSVLDYAVTDIPRQKILLGIPNYGYDWPLPWIEGETRAQSISNAGAVGIAARHGAEILYDQRAQAPYFRYTDSPGKAHEVWFEDARSINVKLGLVAEYRLGGVGYWNLMREFPQNWLLLNTAR